MLTDPRDFHIPDYSEKIDTEYRNHIEKMVFCRWLPFLSGSEAKVVMFIYARTILYWKRWEYVSIDMLQYGFPFRETRGLLDKLKTAPNRTIEMMSSLERGKLSDGDIFVVPPTGLSKSNIVIALQSLTNKGFILRDKQGQQTMVCLNPDARFDFEEVLLKKKIRKGKPRPRRTKLVVYTG